MPKRDFVAKRLEKLLSSISHHSRIRIIAELGNRELCVSELKDILGISSSSVSRHLSVLKSAGTVSERREGHHVYYNLTDQELAVWLIDAIKFIEPDQEKTRDLSRAIKQTQLKWLHGNNQSASGKRA